MATNWFPHDSSASNDQRILLIREKYGWEGYGLYWAILEAMYETTDGMLDTDVLRALYLRFSVKKDYLIGFIRFCIDAKLFVEADGAVFSERLVREKERMIEKSEQAKLAVSMRKDRRMRKPKSTDVEPTYNGRSTPPHSTVPTVPTPDSSFSDENVSAHKTKVVDPVEMEIRQFLPILSEILQCPKTCTAKAIKRWKKRREKFSARELGEAFVNLQKEPDRWKIKNNGWRPLAWWLESDDRIEEMQNCHLKGGGLTVIA